MTRKTDREKDPSKASAASAKKEASAARRENKVPEGAENFEHVLRRIAIEKGKAR